MWVYIYLNYISISGNKDVGLNSSKHMKLYRFRAPFTVYSH